MIAIWTRTDCYEWSADLYGLTLTVFDAGREGPGRFHAFVFDGGDTMDSGTFADQESARSACELWAKGVAVDRAPCPGCGSDLCHEPIDDEVLLLCRECGYDATGHEFTDAELGFAEVAK